MKWLVRDSDYRNTTFLNQYLYCFALRSHCDSIPVYNSVDGRVATVDNSRSECVDFVLFGIQYFFRDSRRAMPMRSKCLACTSWFDLKSHSELGECSVLSLAANPHNNNKNATSEQFNRFPVFAFCARRHRLLPKRKNDYIVLLSYLNSESGIVGVWLILCTRPTLYKYLLKVQCNGHRHRIPTI